jgi:DNA ligase-1
MQAHRYLADKHDVGGFYLSTKLDGKRCFWDGGLTRDMPTNKVPWANVLDPKTGKPKKNIKKVATGLWSRYGNPISAPDWWLNQLPCIPLDGELWAGNKSFDYCISVCSKKVAVAKEWNDIEYAILGSPPIESIFMDGSINNPQFRLNIKLLKIRDWIAKRPTSRLVDYQFLPLGTPFEQELRMLQNMVPLEGNIYLHRQKKLPLKGFKEVIEHELDMVLKDGGEGIVLRAPYSVWTPHRSHDVLKYKPYLDDEGVVVGFTSGKATERGSKYLGMIGALILDYNGKRLELAGLTDAEREFQTRLMSVHAQANPGKDMPPGTCGKLFKVGQLVTFRYRELSPDGLPKEGRFLRKREAE